MTQEEYDNKMKKIKEQETDEIKIELDPIDKDHLNCLWYGGEVGIITYKGWTITIGAYGDIRMSIPEEDIEIKDTGNNGYAYSEIGYSYTDSDIERLDDENKIIWDDNNWFEVDLIDPDGDWYDLGHTDNVLDDNLLDNFTNIETYFEYVEDAIKEYAEGGK